MVVTPYSSQFIAFVTLTVFSTSGCSSLIPSTQRGVATEYNQHCGPEGAKTRPNRAPVHVKSTVQVEPSEQVRQQLSPVARRIAETIEVMPLLNALLDTQTPRSTLEVVIRRLQLM